MEFDYFEKIRKIRTGIRFYSELLVEASWNMWNIKTRVGIFFFSLLIAFLGTYFLAPEAFSEAQTYFNFFNPIVGYRGNSPICCRDNDYRFFSLYYGKYARSNNFSGRDFCHMV